MKCEILHGPEAGQVKHFANNDSTAHTLIRAGVMRLVENEPGDMVRAQNGGVFPVMAPPAEPKWYAGYVQTTFYQHGWDKTGEPGQAPAIVFEIGTTVKELFTGDPADAQRAFGGRKIPADVLKQYKQIYKG